MFPASDRRPSRLASLKDHEGSGLDGEEAVPSMEQIVVGHTSTCDTASPR